MPLIRRNLAQNNWALKPTAAGTEIIQRITRIDSGSNVLVAVFDHNSRGQNVSLPILVSTDLGNSWQRVQSPIPDDALYGYSCALKCIGYGNGTYIAAGNRMFASSDLLTGWQEIPNGQIAGLTLDVKYGAAEFVAASEYNIYRSTDARSWVLVHNHVGANLSRARLAYDNARNLWVMGGVQAYPQTGLETWHVSNNSGLTWVAVPPPAAFEQAVSDVAFGQGSFLAVGGRNNPVLGISQSGDGSDWQLISAPFAGAGALSAIAYDGINQEWLIASSSGKFFVSTDKINWQLANTSGITNLANVTSLVAASAPLPE
jgi:hypothetical protein